MGAVFGSLDRDDDVLALGLNRAVDLIAKKMASVRTLGHASEGRGVRHGAEGPVRALCAARQDGGQPAARHDMDDVTLDEAVALLAEKGKTLKPRGAAGRKGKAGAKGDAGAKRAAPRMAAANSEVPKPAAKKASAGKKKAGSKKAAAHKSVNRAPRRAAE